MIVEIDGIGSVKIVASKTEDTTRHYLSTDLGRSAAEILELVEHRGNIETVHEESNQKFGFKQYQLERKQAIERYIQLVFLAWTLVTFAEQTNVAFWEERGGLSVRLDHAKEAYLVETLLELTEGIGCVNRVIIFGASLTMAYCRHSLTEEAFERIFSKTG